MVSGMVLKEECDEEMFVGTEHEGEPMVIPLARIEAVSTDKRTREAVNDWHYWVQRGYELPRHPEEEEG